MNGAELPRRALVMAWLDAEARYEHADEAWAELQDFDRTHDIVEGPA